MRAFAKVYLDDVVENQGNLFDYVSLNYPDSDTEDFICSYMRSNTRRYIDESQAYVNTMSYWELLDYFMETDNYSLKPGKALGGFIPMWIGEFYAYYQWYYNISSSEVLEKLPLEYMKRAYYGLRDLELELAVEKVHDYLFY